jgi:hypothetical protein
LTHKNTSMRKRLPLLLLFIIAGLTAYSQDISGTWHGFQVSRDKGRQEYRVTVDLKLTGQEDVTGTMQLKSPQKGVITSSFSGKLDKKEGLIYLQEDSIITEGIGAKDASLCSFVLKVRKNSLKGKGRSSQKGYDHLELRLERKDVY